MQDNTKNALNSLLKEEKELLKESAENSLPLELSDLKERKKQSDMFLKIFKNLGYTEEEIVKLNRDCVAVILTALYLFSENKEVNYGTLHNATRIKVSYIKRYMKQAVAKGIFTMSTSKKEKSFSENDTKEFVK